MTEHQAWVSVYGKLERGWVGRAPIIEDGEHCLMTGMGETVNPGRGAYTDAQVELLDAMRDLLSEVTGVPWFQLHLWSDAGPKEKVLAAVMECANRTAPAPQDLSLSELTEASEVLS